MPIKITLTPAFEPPVMLPFIWTLILFMLGKLLSTTVIKLASLSFVGIANAKFIEFTKEITVDTSSWRKVSTDSDNPINLHCLYETYATPHISSYSVCIKSKISFIWSYCIKHISIN